LLSLCKKAIKENNHATHQLHIQRIHIKIKAQDITIPQIPQDTNNPAQNQTYLEWREQLSQMLTVIKTVHKTTLQSQITADIQQYTKTRYDMLANNKKAMIRNILERPTRSIVLNKLITLNPKPKILFEPNDILMKVKQHFEQWTQKRNIKDIQDFPHWKTEYQPKNHIQESWYHKSLDPFTIEEIKNVIHSRANTLASGSTGIPYIALKHLTDHNLQHILKLFNKILTDGITPKEWSKGTIYPYPNRKTGKTTSTSPDRSHY
jgi:hypothetical protein